MNPKFPVATLVLISFLPFVASERPEVAPLLIPKTSIGKELSIGCTSIGGTKPISFSWKKDDHQIEDSKIDKARESIGYSFLIIKSVSSSDRGNYSCTARNSFGEDTKSAELNIAIPASWIVEPVDISSIDGGFLTLSCSAEGFPPPTISLVRILPVDQGREEDVKATGSSTVSFNISSVSKSHAGVYACTASNSPSPLRKEFKVSVHGQ